LSSEIVFKAATRGFLCFLANCFFFFSLVFAPAKNNDQEQSGEKSANAKLLKATGEEGGEQLGSVMIVQASRSFANFGSGARTFVFEERQSVKASYDAEGREA
jgi:hypothetical protein